MPDVLLIRHGESEANAGLPTRDPKDIALTSPGYKQAKDIAEYLKAYRLDLIITSPYLRAIETARPTTSVFEADSENFADEFIWPEVREFTYLSSLHHTYSTIEERRPRVAEYWCRCDPFAIDGPDSESFAQFIERVRKVLRDLGNLEDRYEIVALFSHEQFINAAIWLIERGPVKISSETMRQFRRYLDENALENGAIARIRFSHREHRWSREWLRGHPSLKPPALTPLPDRTAN